MDYGKEVANKRGKLVDIPVELVIDSKVVVAVAACMVVVTTHPMDFSTNRRPSR